MGWRGWGRDLRHRAREEDTTRAASPTNRPPACRHTEQRATEHGGIAHFQRVAPHAKDATRPVGSRDCSVAPRCSGRSPQQDTELRLVRNVQDTHGHIWAALRGTLRQCTDVYAWGETADLYMSMILGYSLLQGGTVSEHARWL